MAEWGIDFMGIISMIFLAIGFSLVVAAAWSGQKMDGDRASAPASESMRLFLRYGSGLTSILGFIYFFVSFFVFGWWTILIFLSALIIQYLPLKIAFKYGDYLPLICGFYIITANIICMCSLLYAF